MRLYEILSESLVYSRNIQAFKIGDEQAGKYRTAVQGFMQDVALKMRERAKRQDWVTGVIDDKTPFKAIMYLRPKAEKWGEYKLTFDRGELKIEAVKKSGQKKPGNQGPVKNYDKRNYDSLKIANVVLKDMK